MKVCSSCGHSNGEDAEFCVKCGAYFPGSPGAPKVSDDSDLPSDPMDRGFALMAQGRFSEAFPCWTSAVRDGHEITDAEYSRMVSSSTDTLLNTIMSFEQYRRARAYELALELDDRDLLTDMMGRLESSRGVCSMQAGVLGLTNMYVYLALDCFNVYPDIRDMRDIWSKAVEDIGSLRALAQGMPPSEGKPVRQPLAWLDNYLSFAELLSGVMDRIVSENDAGLLDDAADHWSSVNNSGCVNLIVAAFNSNTQLMVAGKLTSKLMVKTRDMQLDAFVKTYLNVPRSARSDDA